MNKKPVSTDRDDDIKTQDGTENNVNIHIDRKGFGYNSIGTERETASNVVAGDVKVFLKNNEPKIGFKRYMHKVKGTQDGEYKKISDTGRKFKNNNQEISGISVNGEVKYVYVYFGGTNGDKPLLIALCTNSSGTDQWKYYKNGNLSDPNSRTWSVENTIDGVPDNTNHAFIMHLDKLNDKAIEKTVIHLEKTNEKGTIPDGTISSGNGKYNTGSGNTDITVARETTSSKVPQGYVAYEHKCVSELTDVKFRHNGTELKGFPGTITIAQGKKVWVFYQKDDPKLDKPLLLYFKNGTGSNATHNWYGKGKKWEHHSKLTVDASASLPTGDDKATIKYKLNAIFYRQGTFKELNYCKSIKSVEGGGKTDHDGTYARPKHCDKEYQRNGSEAPEGKTVAVDTVGVDRPFLYDGNTSGEVILILNFHDLREWLYSLEIGNWKS